MMEKFSKIAVFQYSSEAQIIKSRLESEGIEVFLFDQFTVDTDPLVSNAIGGIKLKVWAEDEERALKILSEISGQANYTKKPDVICPICGSSKTESFTQVRNVKSFFLYLFTYIFSPVQKRKVFEFHCNFCKQNFDL